MGGIIGHVWEDTKAYVLNSYNTGRIIGKAQNTGGASGGIVGNTNGNGVENSIILNSYNHGELEANSHSQGIVSADYMGNCEINNVYNIGSVFASSNKNYSILRNETTGMVDVKNTYYLPQENVLPTNTSNTDGMYEITNEIKNNLVNILNENKNKINLSEYGEEIKDYELVNWIQGIDGYPTLEGVGK